MGLLRPATRLPGPIKLSEKIRELREVEGPLSRLNTALTQQKMVRAIADEAKGKTISQQYVSQVEFCARLHLTSMTRLTLALLFKVNRGHLVEDPADHQVELRTRGIVED
jgi:hypothetical protein